jgi:2-dehydro-3-deoxygluconokinase
VSGVVTLGETMGLFTASSIGSLTHAEQFRLGIGGAESNVAIGLARLGTASTWIGRVGADEVGDLILRELRAEGVSLRATTDAAAQTAVMVKNRRTAHTTRVLYYRAASAGSRLSPEDIDAGLIAEADVLHITGITPALSKSAAAAVSHAIDLAESAGVPVSFDVNHRTALWSVARASEVYRSLAARATIVFAGLDEAAMLSEGSSAADFAVGIAALGASEVMIKLGRDGCFALIDGHTFTVPAIPVDAIDTVGAGDAFVAGYLAERCAGAVPMARLQTGVEAGAFACLGLGDWESLPTRGDLALLARDEPVER